MAIPTWNVGQVLTSSDVNTWFVPLVVQKPSDLNRTGTSPSNDPDLQLAMAANAAYIFQAYIRVNGGLAVGNVQWTWTVPASAVMRYTIPAAVQVATPSTTNTALNLNGGATIHLVTNASDQGYALTGSITTAGTAGNLIFQWSQDTTNAGGCTLQQYSWLMLQRIG